MKKFFLILPVFSMLTSYAQKFYAGAGGAALWPLAGPAIASNYSSDGNTYSYSSERGSYGSGFNLHGFVGYNLNEHIAFELGASYLFGKEYTTKADYNSISVYIHNSSTTSMELVNIMPAIKLSAPVAFGVPYLKVGMLAGFASVTTKDKGNEFMSTNDIDRKREITGNMAWGAFSGIGFRKNFGNRFGAYIEYVFLLQNYLPAKSTVTAYKVNGQDQLGSLKPVDKETRYSDKLNGSFPLSDDEPSKSPPVTYYACSMGVQAGVIVNVGGKK